MTIPMSADEGEFRLMDSGTITAGYMDGVAGLTLENATLESRFEMVGSTTNFVVERIATDGGYYSTENMRVRIPRVGGSVQTQWNPATESADFVFRLLEESELVEGDLQTTYRAGTERWEAQ